ncbi:diguanylate cyclase [Desulfogranum mediterraneum]|uniref:diguanylate cyclase n=1 Tax=Desulfogranum mediterraneum TaxID=160661 RepID=UPI000405720C|nr:diguanylate cyclase [Desulfogranum mediterraneum]
MRNILLVEDSTMFGRLTKKKIETVFNVPVYWTRSLAETEKVLQMAAASFSLALLDYNLPDAPHGEVIDRVTQEGISSLVFTSNMSEEVRDFVWSKKVADYILKEDPNSLDYIISSMRQLEENHNNLVLVVDDSATYRAAISQLLYVRKYRVLNARDGESCLKILQQHPEIKLVITDFNMPGMDGCALCQKIRRNFKADRVAIMGISSEDDRNIGARFIKSGANDFIVKHAFLVEEFYSRVNHCIETVNLFKQIHENAIRDFLTGLYNRRYFFETGTDLCNQYPQDDERLACAMIDIDHFKEVNDTHGHDIGDQVIQNIAQLLQDSAGSSDLVARIGGEEFCMLTPISNSEELRRRFETLRREIETTAMATTAASGKLFVTVSTGLCLLETDSLETMMKVADECLYQAKRKGRNRIEESVLPPSG